MSDYQFPDYMDYDYEIGGHLNFKGDVTHIVGDVLGPGIDGVQFWVAREASYDDTTDMTRVACEAVALPDLEPC